MITVIKEDFSDFEIGDFPYDKEHSALGEYHHLEFNGYTGNWYDPITSYAWRSNGPSWLITELDGKKYIESMRESIISGVFKDIAPILVHKEDDLWDYTLEVTIRMFNTKEKCGVLFDYIHARHHFGLCFENGNLVLYKKNQEELTILKSYPYSYDCDHYYKLKLITNNKHFIVSVDNKIVFETEVPEILGGKIALISKAPAQFTDIILSMEDLVLENRRLILEKRTQELIELQNQYPKPRLWKTIDLKNFGTARQIRFGHLTGTLDWYIVLAQHQKRIMRDAYARISCLTAIDLEGNILWQVGTPGKKIYNTRISADLPFQVYDIDGDGIDEVICAIDFKLQILDGKTGKVKKWVYTPNIKDHAFDRLNVDSIRIANFSGNNHPSDIIIKDRYHHVFVYDGNLNFLWDYAQSNTGHFPYTTDINSDGFDEMVVGYELVNKNGKTIWSLPINTDHTDEIIATDKYILMASGNEGFIMVDYNGKIIKKHQIGHAQRISIGKFNIDTKDFDICLTTYWGEQGIIYLFDEAGNLYHEFEPGTNGNIITPVNWVGDGTELILLHGGKNYGGLMDGKGKIVVKFPDDNHPSLCAESIDLTGDNRDEIILWDESWMYIYTQENVLDQVTYCPQKYPNYNASNYRGEYSIINKNK